MFTHSHEKELGELKWDRILMTLRLVVSSKKPNWGNEGCRCDRGNLCTHLSLLWAWMKFVMNELFPSPISFNVSQANLCFALSCS
jgi:hypothetical protein